MPRVGVTNACPSLVRYQMHDVVIPELRVMPV
jgi:hypothetical protein